jgi:hypothetical protein
MTRKVKLAILAGVAPFCFAVAQESPTPSPTASPTPEQPGSSASARNVTLRFVPPPMEGTVSLGIFDSNDKLVRVLHREAKVDKFTVEENSLSTTWDGKNDAGEDSPAGKYRARGYLVAPFKAENLGKVQNAANDGNDHISVKLVTNPLVSDTRSVVDLGVMFDSKGSFLRTMDGLPLRTISETPNISRISITKNGERSADVWQDDGNGLEQFRLSNIDKIMAFDCGFFELR